MKNHKKELVICFVLGLSLVGFIYKGIYSSDNQLTFDRLYPENLFTKTKEQCMQVWATLDDMVQHKKQNIPHDFLINTFGQLAYAKHCVQNMVQHKVPIAYDDLLYISRVVGTIDERCTQLPQSIAQDKIGCLRQQVGALKKKVQLLLQANNTSASASH